ncbi:hypothetical protein BU17DRAFT_75781 [Hysterangium stoloniferum]|nr:hypothetical protein BU17DRAFT_75781 [Hysterangium stoloniferum]
MKFSPALVALTATSLVSSHRILLTQSTSRQPQSLATQNESVPAGAAYFITNEPDGNYIIASDIGADGKLTFKHAIWAGGRGAHGLMEPLAPDGLFSQGAIRVAGKNVFTVNAGSNTAVMFSIDPNEPTKLRMVGGPVSSGGEFPVSIAISKQSGQVCVLNGGRLNGVNCYKQDPSLGLVQMSNTLRSLNLNVTTPPSGPVGTVSDVIFNEDGTQLLAAVKGVPPAEGFVASWAVDPTSGDLAEDFIRTASPPSGVPFSMTIIPGKDAVLSADPIGGFDIFDFRNAQQGSSTAFPIPGQLALCWTTFSKETGNFYLIDAGTSIITEVNVDSNLNATIVNQYPQASGGATIGTIDSDVANIDGTEFFYSLAALTQSVVVLSLNAPGKTTPVQQFSFQDAVSEAGIKTDPNNLKGMALFVGQ